MRLATAHASVKLETMAAAVRAAGAKLEVLAAETWHATIEVPATALAQTALPELSRGWGAGLLAIGGGHLAPARSAPTAGPRPTAGASRYLAPSRRHR